MNKTSDARLKRAIESLEGLSMGDAFGEGFFMSFELAARLAQNPDLNMEEYLKHFRGEEFFVLRELIDIRRIDVLDVPWRWTDDSALAIEVVENLRIHGEIQPASLAVQFSNRYKAEPNRGYGGAMHSLLPNLTQQNWRTEAAGLFEGQGSFGNGAAMRAAPIGAYFADDLDLVVENATRSAIVTHSHSEGIAGAVAVALGAAFLARLRENAESWDGKSFLELILERLPNSEVKSRIQEASQLDENLTSEQVAEIIGSGYAIAAQDTVPFCLWCVAKALEDYDSNFEEAMWQTVAGLGDRDTTCAIVGGIMGVYVGVEGIPVLWRENREALPLIK